MSELSSMRNIGRELEKKLKAVGVCSADELRRIGGKEAFLLLKTRFPNVCLVHLYALYGAVGGIDYNKIPEEAKRGLKAFSDGLK